MTNYPLAFVRIIFLMILMFFVHSANSAIAQKTPKKKKPCEAPKEARILTNSYQCYWKMSEITDTIIAEIVQHEPSYTPCAFKPSASVTIVKVGKKLIRVLDFCNLRDFKVGEKVKIAPIEPPYSKVYIPTFFEKDPATGQYIYHCNDYDAVVKKTIWAQIITGDESPIENLGKIKTLKGE